MGIFEIIHLNTPFQASKEMVTLLLEHGADPSRMLLEGMRLVFHEM